MPNPSDIIERMALVEAKASAAHERLDRNELGTREQLKEIKEGIREISDELKLVVGWMNRSLGWAAAAVFIAGLLGSGVTALVSKLLK